MDLFGFQVSQKEQFSLSLGNSAVWLTQVTLKECKGKAQLFVKRNNQKFAVCCLSENRPNAILDLKIDSEDISFEVLGNGVVEILGNKQDFAPLDEGEECPDLVCAQKCAMDERPAKKAKLDLPTEPKKEAKKQEVQKEEPKKAEVKKEAKKSAAEEQKKATEEIVKNMQKVTEDKKAKQEAHKAQQEAAAKKKNVEEEKKKKEAARLEEEKRQKAEKAKAEQQKKKQNGDLSAPIKKQLPSGLKYEISRVGKGAVADRARTVKVAYDGRLASNGKRFDKGTIAFKLGLGEVIRGWDEGVKGMAVGEKRKLLIPAHLGYGARGAPPQIPRNAALVFDVELLSVR